MDYPKNIDCEYIKNGYICDRPELGLRRNMGGGVHCCLMEPVVIPYVTAWFPKDCSRKKPKIRRLPK